MKRHTLLTLLLGAGALAVAAAPVHRSARPVVRCSLPVRWYQLDDRSQPVSSVSAVGILVREPLPLSLTDPRDPRLASLYADPLLLRGVRRYEFVQEPRLTDRSLLRLEDVPPAPRIGALDVEFAS
jgi:hypothetical protein